MNTFLPLPASDYATVDAVLRSRAAHQPDRPAFTFLEDGDAKQTTLTYAQLDQRARIVAAQLQSIGAPGERALLLYPSGLDFVIAFFACLYSGVIAIPAPPPYATQLKRALPRLQAIMRDAQPMAVLSLASTLTTLDQARAQLPELNMLRCIATDTPDAAAGAWRDPQLPGTALAFLQYTSGSTASPKGVMVSHHNLLHHAAYIRQVWKYQDDSVGVTWMPNFHDYGLIEGIIHAVYSGAPSILMTPRSFVQQPVRWLRAISRFNATNSAGPNFAYELCVRKIKDEQCEGLDLSSWRVAGNGAEPVREETLRAFADKFAPYGFRWSTFYPSYGLAEATLVVAAGGSQTGPQHCTVQKAALEQQHRIAPVEDGARDGRTLVSNGAPLLDTRVAIVDPATGTRCAPDGVGEIWVASPSVAQGYWNRPQETRDTFQARLAPHGDGPFLRTGDLGFLKDGQLFVTGRLKDLIIIRGNNHYPQDIERTVQQSHAALRPDCGAAFSIDIDGEERLIVVQEVERQTEATQAELVKAIRWAVAEEHEVQVHDVALIRAGTIAKTSSGKIQRRACREAYMSGALKLTSGERDEL